MKNDTTTQNPIIAKMAQILMLIEKRITEEGRVYLPKQRSRFIDLTALGLSDHEDSFFTYDQIKQLVANMVTRHESGSGKWHIDLANSTTNTVAVVGEHGHSLSVPISLFMASTTNDSVARLN